MKDVSMNLLITDDLAFSAYLKMKGFTLIESRQKTKNIHFVFDIDAEDQNQLKVEFINSEFLDYYNEVRNLKKIVMS